jgi:hypothetical protein
MSRTYPRGSSLQENKTLLSKLATIMVSMVTILLIALMSVGKKRMTRRRRRRRRRGATRKTSITRRNPMVKCILGWSGTLMMRLLTPIVKVA